MSNFNDQNRIYYLYLKNDARNTCRAVKIMLAIAYIRNTIITAGYSIVANPL